MMGSTLSLGSRALLHTTRLVRLLRRDDSGLALTEFALSLPIFLSLGLLGTETAHYVVTHMRVSQIAMQIADNASRVGEQDVLVERRIFEDDINDVFVGADKLGGGLDILENGRVILSSLEQNGEGGQWIHWQRCKGLKNHVSDYGDEGDGASGTSFPGMGRPGEEITASSGNAVMFVQFTYEYQPITPISAMDGQAITYTAAFNVRDSRDLTQIHQTTPVSAVSDCDTFSAS